MIYQQVYHMICGKNIWTKSFGFFMVISWRNLICWDWGIFFGCLFLVPFLHSFGMFYLLKHCASWKKEKLCCWSWCSVAFCVLVAGGPNYRSGIRFDKSPRDLRSIFFFQNWPDNRLSLTWSWGSRLYSGNKVAGSHVVEMGFWELFHCKLGSHNLCHRLK